MCYTSPRHPKLSPVDLVFVYTGRIRAKYGLILLIPFTLIWAGRGSEIH